MPTLKPAARKLTEIANLVEAVQDGRIFIELINGPMLFELKATLAHARPVRHLCEVNPGRGGVVRLVERIAGDGALIPVPGTGRIRPLANAKQASGQRNTQCRKPDRRSRN
jgi:hypothetical protein